MSTDIRIQWTTGNRTNTRHIDGKHEIRFLRMNWSWLSVSQRIWAETSNSSDHWLTFTIHLNNWFLFCTLLCWHFNWRSEKQCRTINWLNKKKLLKKWKIELTVNTLNHFLFLFRLHLDVWTIFDQIGCGDVNAMDNSYVSGNCSCFFSSHYFQFFIDFE